MKCCSPVSLNHRQPRETSSHIIKRTETIVDRGVAEVQNRLNLLFGVPISTDRKELFVELSADPLAFS